MQNKVLFDVCLPLTAAHYDFWVPGDMTMHDATCLVAEAMGTIAPDFYVPAPDAALMLASTGQIQDLSATVDDIGFVDGTSFVLV